MPLLSPVTVVDPLSMNMFSARTSHNNPECQPAPGASAPCYRGRTAVATARSAVFVRRTCVVLPRQVVCPREDCGKTFSQSYNLKRHGREHTRERPFVCQLHNCGQRFAHQSSLQRHLRSHRAQKSFVCCHEGCANAFTRKDNLRAHLRTHAGEKPFSCPWENCEKRFGQAPHLTEHLRCHTGERPFVCPVQACGARFVKSSHLAEHRRIHSEEKPFSCLWEKCGRRFKRASHLNVHCRSHTTQKSFVCPHADCGRGFVQSSTLRRHMHVHKGGTSASGSRACGRPRQQTTAQCLLPEETQARLPAVSSGSRVLTCGATRPHRRSDRRRSTTAPALRVHQYPNRIAMPADRAQQVSPCPGWQRPPPSATACAMSRVLTWLADEYLCDPLPPLSGARVSGQEAFPSSAVDDNALFWLRGGSSASGDSP